MVLRPVVEAQRLLAVSKPTVYRLCAAGAIPAFKVGNTWRVDMDRLEKLIEKSLGGTSDQR